MGAVPGLSNRLDGQIQTSDPRCRHTTAQAQTLLKSSQSSGAASLRKGGHSDPTWESRTGEVFLLGGEQEIRRLRKTSKRGI